MTATFSVFALEAMGFREVVEKGALLASFMSVTVYEARGITLPKGFAEARQARVAGAEYRVALAKEVNAGCRKLIGDDFAESEPDWRKETEAIGPFILIAVGPTDYIGCEAGRMMRQADHGITTYDSFRGLREVLKSLEERVLPPVVASLTLALNQPGHYVSLRKVTRASVGRSLDGTIVHDIRLDVRAEVIVSRSLEDAKAAALLDASIERAPKLHQQAARYFALGAAEEDQLKKFLYFFLSLEIETHAVFKRINHSAKTRALVSHGGSGSPLPSAVELLARNVASWDNLFDRFAWCANCAWPHLADEDVLLFKKLKKARDAIAHGDESEPPLGFAHQAELLAHKVLLA
jgi:hypothetical protein